MRFIASFQGALFVTHAPSFSLRRTNRSGADGTTSNAILRAPRPGPADGKRG